MVTMILSVCGTLGNLSGRNLSLFDEGKVQSPEYKYRSQTTK